MISRTGDPSRSGSRMLRSRRTWFCSALAADRGGVSPHSVSINSSVLTVRLARATRWASRARSLALGSAICPASLHTCSGPRTANSSFDAGAHPGSAPWPHRPVSCHALLLTISFRPAVTAQSQRGCSRTCHPIGLARHAVVRGTANRRCGARFARFVERPSVPRGVCTGWRVAAFAIAWLKLLASSIIITGE